MFDRLIVDESHVTYSQVQVIYNCDQARKKVLIEQVFPSAQRGRQPAPQGSRVLRESRPNGGYLCKPVQLEDEGERRRGGRAVELPDGGMYSVLEVPPTTGQFDALPGEIRT